MHTNNLQLVGLCFRIRGKSPAAAHPRDRSASKSAINEALMFSVKNEIFILPPASEKFYRTSEARLGFFRCLIRDKNFV